MTFRFKSAFSLTYQTAKYFDLVRLHLGSFRAFSFPPILVYQMGKVGSSTVVNSLKKSLTNVPIYHVHTLRSDHLAAEEKLIRMNFSRRKQIDYYLLHGLYLCPKVKKIKRRRWRIITLVRDPVSKNISAFFQTLNLHHAQTGFADRIRHGDHSVLDELVRYFVNEFDHLGVLSWFDREFKTIFGFDILAHEFNPFRGYKIHRHNLMDILLIRLEDLNKCAPEAMKEFLGISDFELIDSNSSDKKYYRDIYKEFVNQLVLPEPLLDAIYSSRYARTFYTPDEIERSKARWRVRPHLSLDSRAVLQR